MTSRRPFLVAAAATLGLIAGLLLGAGAVLAQDPTVAGGSPPLGSDPSVGIAPAAVPEGTTSGAVTSGSASGGSGVAAAGAAIAYPYLGGTPGIAPDDTIVVTGVGQAPMKNDGSDRASAQKTAIAAALADAKSQADAIASGTGLSIDGVLSVSASVSPGYGVPMMGATSGSEGIACPVEPPTKSATVPEPICPPTYQQSLAVSVTVAYRVA